VLNFTVSCETGFNSSLNADALIVNTNIGVGHLKLQKITW
jgi:hypothetical protein